MLKLLPLLFLLSCYPGTIKTIPCHYFQSYEKCLYNYQLLHGDTSLYVIDTMDSGGLILKSRR